MRLVSDTHPEVARRLAEMFRAMPPEVRKHKADQLYAFAKHAAYQDVRRRHPDADAEEVRLRVASRFLSPEIMLRVYGWDVRERGY
jgi:hypothetical protein